MVFGSLALLAAVGLSQSDPWPVSSTNCLLEGNRPYIPVGLNIDGTIEQIRLADEAGVKDVVVNLGLGGEDWEPIIKALETREMRYLVSISSPAPTAETVAIEPESYRLPNLEGAIHTQLRIPNVSKAVGVVASQSTGNVRWSGVLEAKDGEISFSLDREVPNPHVLILYPFLKSNEIPDYWEQFDLHRDMLLAKVQRAGFGKGYRGMIDPFGKVEEFMRAQSQSIPTSPFFRMELEAYLEQKYGKLGTAIIAWGLSVSAVQSLADLTHLVPMWSEYRGLESAWDLKTGRIVKVDRSQSAMWKDIRAVMFSSAVRRYNRLAESVREMTKRPVIQSWGGWGGPYETSEIRLEGVSVESSADSVIDFVDDVARPISSARRSTRPVATIASRIELSDEEGSPRVNSLVTSTTGIGVRGWYFRANTAARREEVSQVARLIGSDVSLADGRSSVLYYPEAAQNPAIITQVSPGMWWLPAPGAGSKLDFGEGIEGYQYSDGSRRSTVFWAVDTPRRVKFKVADSSLFKFSSISDANLDLRTKKTEIEMTVPTTPVVVEDAPELLVPVASYEITVAMIDALLLRFGSKIDIEGTARGKISDVIRSFDRNPGSAFLQLRDMWRKFATAAAPYDWIEGETCPDNTFSTILTTPGASGDKVLELSAKVFWVDSEHYANFSVVRPEAGRYDVWLAGRIPEQLIPLVHLRVGEDSYSVSPTRYSFYGAGLAWYHLDSVELKAGQNTVSLTCPPGFQEPLLLDTLVISPTPFVPSGSRQPMNWLLQYLGKGEPIPPRRD